MRLNNECLLVLALAHFGAPLYPPTPYAYRMGRDGRDGRAGRRSVAIKHCRLWQLLNADNALTSRGLDALRSKMVPERGRRPRHGPGSF